MDNGCRPYNILSNKLNVFVKDTDKRKRIETCWHYCNTRAIVDVLTDLTVQTHLRLALIPNLKYHTRARLLSFFNKLDIQTSSTFVFSLHGNTGNESKKRVCRKTPARNAEEGQIA